MALTRQPATAARRPLSVDGFASRAAGAHGPTRPVHAQSQPLQPAVASQAQPVTAAKAARVYAKPPAPKAARRTMPGWITMPLIIFGGMAGGVFAQSSTIGQLMVVAYGIIAFFCRIRSRTTFTLAFLAMVATIFLMVVRGNLALAQNFATYTFLLLVVGVITLSREIKKEGGRVYSRRQY